MFEVYLFVNPACANCLFFEQEVTKISNELNCKVCLRFIPYINLNSINEASQLKLDSYQMTIDYKAALYQGCKKGRKFLELIQELTLIEKEAYTKQLVEQAAKAVNLDLEMFWEDCKSEMVKEAIISDLKMVHEMGIKSHDSLVLFDCRSNNNGLLLEKINNLQLNKLFERLVNKSPLDDLKKFTNLHVL